MIEEDNSVVVKFAMPNDEVREAMRLTRINLKSTAVLSVFRAGLMTLQRQEELNECAVGGVAD